MSKILIGLTSMFIITLIIGCLVNTKRWAKKNDQPQLIDLIRGKRSKK